MSEASNTTHILLSLSVEGSTGSVGKEIFSHGKMHMFTYENLRSCTGLSNTYGVKLNTTADSTS